MFAIPQAQELWVMESLTVLDRTCVGLWHQTATFRSSCCLFLFSQCKSENYDQVFLPSVFTNETLLFLIYCCCSVPVVNTCLCYFIQLYSLLMCRIFYYYYYYYHYYNYYCCCYYRSEDLLKKPFCVEGAAGFLHGFTVTVCFCILLTLKLFFLCL